MYNMKASNKHLITVDTNKQAMYKQLQLINTEKDILCTIKCVVIYYITLRRRSCLIICQLKQIQIRFGTFICLLCRYVSFKRMSCIFNDTSAPRFLICRLIMLVRSKSPSDAANGADLRRGGRGAAGGSSEWGKICYRNDSHLKSCLHRLMTGADEI